MNRRERRRKASQQKTATTKVSGEALEQMFKQASALYQQNKLSDAFALINKVLSYSPSHPSSLCLRGAISIGLNKIEDGLNDLRQAVKLQPNVGAYQNNLGIALSAQAQYRGAAEALRKAHALEPSRPDYAINFAAVLRNLGAFAEALRAIQTVLEQDQNSIGALINLANIKDDMGALGEAEAAHRRVLELQPDHQAALNNLGQLLRRQGKMSEAKAVLSRAADDEKASAEALCNLADCLRDIGDIPEALKTYDQALQSSDATPSMHSNGLHCLMMAATDGTAVLKAHKEWQSKWYDGAVGDWTPPAFDGLRKLRIGYISGDFRQHSVAYFLAPLLAAHDKSRISIYCYRTQGPKDEVTERLVSLADHWRDLDGMNTAEIVNCVRGDQLDVLIDLSGHTAGNRLPVFMQRLAGKQISWLGYPTTTGLEQMDGRIVDGWTDPPGAADTVHSEKLIRLANGFNVYRGPDNAPTPELGPGAQGGLMTFGSFNALSKVCDPALDAWSAILLDVPQSKLVLKSRYFGDLGVTSRVVEALSQRGVAKERLELVGWLNSSDHLAYYNRIDIALDTFPYNGTTTTCEALWMGRPVIALEGVLHPGRVGLSLLNRLGRSDWVAGHPDDYVRLAVELAKDRAQLRQWHQDGRKRMMQSPLTDGASFAQAFEAALFDFVSRAKQD